jgi:NTE family protein
VEVEGEPYWDGGYTGNPSIFPLFYHCTSRDVVLIQINPLHIEEVPTQASDILDRVNEISFNAGLMSEMRSLGFVNRLLEEQRLSGDRYKPVFVHLIEAQDIMAPLGPSSKLNADWTFLQHLRDIGRQAAADWIKSHYDEIGVRSSVDVKEVFL